MFLLISLFGILHTQTTSPLMLFNDLPRSEVNFENVIWNTELSRIYV